MSTNSRRRNGLEGPYHPLQIATWVLFPLLLLHFYAFLAPILWDSAYSPIIAVYTFFSFVTLVSGYLTCSIDPADDSVCEVNSQSPNSAAPKINLNDSIYCHLCETRVHSTSKHCTHCRKCVTRFDHHCKWLNTCIGEKNYRYFLVVIWSTAIMTSLSFALSAGYVVDAFGILDDIRQRISHGDNRNNFALALPGVQGVSVVSTALLLPLVLLVYQLVGFHAMLLYRGLTTYDFIVLEQKKQREKARKAQSTPNTPQSKPQIQPKPPASAIAKPTSDKYASVSRDDKAVEETVTNGQNGDEDEDSEMYEADVMERSEPNLSSLELAVQQPQENAV